MSLLACICIVLMFVEFYSLLDGSGMSFIGGIRHAATKSNTASEKKRIYFAIFGSKIRFADYSNKTA